MNNLLSHMEQKVVGGFDVHRSKQKPAHFNAAALLLRTGCRPRMRICFATSPLPDYGWATNDEPFVDEPFVALKL
jgi:hypothetical protein